VPYIKASVYEDLYEVDLSSAYPHAMRDLPPMTRGEYTEVESFDPKHEGIYKISGRTSSCIYPAVFKHDFKPVGPNEEFTDLWTTSYEVRAIRDLKAARLTSCSGYVWIPGERAEQPFARYVDTFYKLKESTPKGDPHYYFYKIMLNSLYGRLLGCAEVRSQHDPLVKSIKDIVEDLPPGFSIDEHHDPVLNKTFVFARYWKASSTYSPFWGSLITGHTRAAIYRLERKLKGVHTATDSVKSSTPHKIVPGLGGLKVETFGRCYIFRNKLYLHCAKDFKYCGHDPKALPFKDERGHGIVDRDGQHLCKVALHGFKGKVAELWARRHELIENGELAYDFGHMVGLREGMIRGDTVCDFQDRTEVLRLRKLSGPVASTARAG
jgi:hypothetical protein